MLKYLPLAIIGLWSFAYGQKTNETIQNYFLENQEKLGMHQELLSNWVIYDEHQSNNSPIRHAYIRQTHNDIEIYDALANFAITENRTVLAGNRLITDFSTLIISSSVNVSAESAAMIALNTYSEDNLGINSVDIIEEGRKYIFSSPSTIENIPVRLMYKKVGNDLRLVWDMNVSPINGEHWWSCRVDAETGEIIHELDWVVQCNYDGTHKHDGSCITRNNAESLSKEASMPMMPPGTDEYRVYPIPIESPNHGARSLVVAPADPTASPYGWHDDNGAMGDEYTITRGNNVHAMEDVNGNNGNGYSPDSGGSNSFDYALDLAQQPNTYQDAAITNLFYMNNIMHDVYYHYGFDEASGNFQEDNYGNGGSASDYVNADAQDGGGMNNANFATPPDGQNPRMQMYLWDGTPDLLTVNSPSGIAGVYFAIEAGFGGPIPATPITADLALYNDGVPDENDACEAPINGAQLNGKIAVIRRGTCEFGCKVQEAEDAGAVAVIMVNNVAGGPITMGAGACGAGVTIPSLMVSDVDGEMLITELESATTINATIQNTGTVDKDGDFDNMIIAHEYGHGISNRLTGGANNTDCLYNEEQMGEGWSDWLGLMLTMEPGDVSTDNRGVGTYVTGESTTGTGIRNAPYNTDFAVNNYTYDDSNDAANVSQPHGVGFVWCTMLWDMTWALIDQYGYDPDIYSGAGGNNIAMHLVMNGMKLQPCEPGFVDGRDAILLADQLLYGGVNQCLIWNAFANRGLGYSADQGSTNSRTDQTEAFDLPPGMINSTGSETVSNCGDYTWPADGNTYTASGTYTTVLTNMYGCDSTVTLNLTINQPPSGGTDVVTSCLNYVWPANGNTYSTTGIYTTTLTAANGCDSIATLDLTISSTSSSEFYETVCESYNWALNSTTYTSSGDYSTTVTGASGCDSIVTLHLTVNYANTGSENVSVCSTYTWPANGNTYTSTGAYTTVLTNANGCDSTVTLNLTVDNVPVYGNEAVTACDTYTWPTNGNTYTTTGAYTANLTSATGCDSIVTLNLTINSADPAVAIESPAGTLEVTTPGATAYQWFYCANGFNVNGQTNQTYTPSSNGDYGVIVTTNGCADTSECYTINLVGIMENDFGDELNVYPNPTSGKLVIDLGIPFNMIETRLYATSGQLVDAAEYIETSRIDYVIEEADGVYMLRITADNKEALIRVIKK